MNGTGPEDPRTKLDGYRRTGVSFPGWLRNDANRTQHQPGSNGLTERLRLAADIIEAFERDSRSSGDGRG